jgi:DNA polymerase-3 subunit gamma/tau
LLIEPVAKKKTATRKAGSGKATRKSTGRKKVASAKDGAAAAGAGAASAARSYVVMARRYRPQQFDEVIGQQAVAQALSGAIEAGRVAHAYLFTGSRGVGKTSMARILAKALNCVHGPTSHPCDECEICRAIISGDDVDVLEIDGASNRGIDEIRELRQNVGFRPSRTRYKVYIIDEVHMLTREAFNALLKTLEEPPPHVKFIFCTTEPHKIPITILSRCQRFDFGPVAAEAIVERLRQIVDAEHVDADDEALEVIARRAAGSMRDSQSLLDQVLAFGDKRITVEQIHQLLGTATEELVSQLGSNLLERRPGPALEAMQSAAAAGVQIEQLIDQLVDYFRDLMVVRYPGPKGPTLHSLSSRRRDQLHEQSQRTSLGNILAAIQILLEAKARMRGSTYAQTLAELALVRIATLEDLEALSGLVQDLQEASDATSADGRAAAAAAQKKTSPLAAADRVPPERQSAPVPAAPAARSAQDDAAESPRARPAGPSPEAAPAHSTPELPHLWSEAVARCDDLFLREQASRASRLALGDDGQLVVFFDEQYNYARNFCARPEKLAALEDRLSQQAGRSVTVVFASCSTDAVERTPQPGTYKQRLADSAREPLVRKVQEVFQATIVRVDDVPGSTD